MNIINFVIMASLIKKNHFVTLAILCVINLFNFADRYTLSGILDLLEHKEQSGFSEDVNDLEKGLLQTSFVIFFAILSPLFGYLGDRLTRTYIIAAGLFLWALFTLLSSFSIEYWMLFVFRGLVGVGEASYATITPTIIADLFPAKVRVRALSLFYLAIPVGSGLGYGIGAGMANIAETLIPANYTHPQNEPWRYAFRLTPLFGFALSLIFLCCIKEPPRGQTDSKVNKSIKGKHGVKAFLVDILYCLKTPSYTLSSLGSIAVSFCTSAWAWWIPQYIVRTSSRVSDDGSLCTTQYTDLTASLICGGLFILGGLLGTISGSELSKYFAKRTNQGDALICGASQLVAAPFVYVSLLLAQYSGCVSVIWPTFFMGVYLVSFCWALTTNIILLVIIPERRSTALALQILITHVLGDATGPFVIGWLSDTIHYSEPRSAIGYPLTCSLYVSIFVLVLGGAAFLATSFFVERDRYRVALHIKKTLSKQEEEESSEQELELLDHKEENSESEIEPEGNNDKLLIETDKVEEIQL